MVREMKMKFVICFSGGRYGESPPCAFFGRVKFEDQKRLELKNSTERRRKHKNFERHFFRWQKKL